MKNNLFVLLLITLVMGACSSSTPEFDNSLPAIKPVAPAVTLEAPAPVTTVETNAPLPKTSTNTVAINPPHGQPGHDCNVAVGSSLGGSANSLSVPAPTPVMPSAVNPVKNVSTSGVKLNPPHGEPGHDCNVQVGQPLSS